MTDKPFPQYLKHRISFIIEMVGQDVYEEAFAHTPMYRQSRVPRREELRRLVWRMLRLPASAGGQRWSFPDIANHTDSAHSTLVEANQLPIRRERLSESGKALFDYATRYIPAENGIMQGVPPPVTNKVKVLKMPVVANPTAILRCG